MRQDETLAEKNMTEQEFLDLMKDSGLDRALVDKIKPLLGVSRCCQISVEPDRRPRTGSSKIGGVPDLPDGASWPSGEDAPLKFLCQINLSELYGAFGLSGDKYSGTLHFYLDENSYPRQAKVSFYKESQSALSPIEVPTAFQDTHLPRATAISFSVREDCIPPRYDSPSFQNLLLSVEQKYAYEDFEYDNDSTPSISIYYEGCSALGGLTPTVFQSLHQLVSPAEGPFYVLLKLDPYENEKTTKSSLVDLLDQRVYFVIPIAAFENRDFSRVRVVFGES